jgi:hypothetical protein
VNILITVPHEDTTIGAAEAAEKLAGACDWTQIEFLAEFARRTGEYCWPFQCRAIVDRMTKADKIAVAACLRTLLEHLEE